MVRGQSDLGFTRQYDGTLPYLYPVEMQLRWGMGWPLGLLVFAAFAWMIWLRGAAAVAANGREPGRFSRTASSLDAQPYWCCSFWAVPFFITTGGFYVKFMRYLQPLTPLLMLFAAALILAGQGAARAAAGDIAAVLVPTAVYALSFMNIYSTDHPWNDSLAMGV